MILPGVGTVVGGIVGGVVGGVGGEAFGDAWKPISRLWLPRIHILWDSSLRPRPGEPDLR